MVNKIIQYWLVQSILDCFNGIVLIQMEFIQTSGISERHDVSEKGRQSDHGETKAHRS